LFFFSSPVIQTSSIALNAFSNPFYQLVSDGKEYVDKPVENTKKEIKIEFAKKARSNARKKIESFTEVNVIPEEHFVYDNPPKSENGFAQVDQRMTLQPKLKKYQEEQVKGTVEATKKILEDGQWKQVEKNVADALTQVEKENLKEKYYTELEKVNWGNLENRLRLSYNQLNWDKINTQLNTAITAIKLDSIQQNYSIVLNDLCEAENWMTENKCQSIPDTDLKLKEIKLQKGKVQEQLKIINAIKLRKIIHL